MAHVASFLGYFAGCWCAVGLIGIFYDAVRGVVPEWDKDPFKQSDEDAQIEQEED